MKEKTRTQANRGSDAGTHSDVLNEGGPRALQHGPEESEAKKTGRWTLDEHFRFIEALQQFGKEWRRVQQHVGTRSSTQARSHAQKFFVKLEKKGQKLDDFLAHIDLESVRQKMVDAGSDQDYEDPDIYLPSSVRNTDSNETAPTIQIVRPADQQQNKNKALNETINQNSAKPPTPKRKVSGEQLSGLKRTFSERADKKEFMGIDLGMNVKNGRSVVSRVAPSKQHSLNIAITKRKKSQFDEELKPVAAEFNIKLEHRSSAQGLGASKTPQIQKQSVGYKQFEGPQQLQNLESANFPDVSLKMQQMPNTCKPAQSANNWLVDKWAPLEMADSGAPNPSFDQMPLVPPFKMAPMHPHPHIVSMTPRLKQSEMRSPIMVAAQRSRVKRAASLKDIDPDDFVIEHKSMLSNEEANFGEAHPAMMPVEFGQGEGEMVARQDSAPTLPAKYTSEPVPFQNFNPTVKEAVNFPKYQLHPLESFENHKQSYPHSRLPVQNILYAKLAPEVMPTQLNMDYVHHHRNSFDGGDKLEMTPQGFNRQYNSRKFSEGLVLLKRSSPEDMPELQPEFRHRGHASSFVVTGNLGLDQNHFGDAPLDY